MMGRMRQRGPDESWFARAACIGMDPELWFPDRGNPALEARAICARCEVKAECLDYALRLQIEEGIWGGTTGRGRRRLKRKVA